jgi:phenylalanine-4-hydroxylase
MEKMVQHYEKYTDEDFKVWKLLFDRQMAQLPGMAEAEYLEAIRTIGFDDGLIPNFNNVNAELQNITGWSIEVVPGLIPNKEFYSLLQSKRFPASTWLRKLEQLDYLQEPDMFHDVFGHIPLLTNKHFSDFLEQFSRMGLRYVDNEYAVELLARIYWYTVEFGLIRNEKGLQIYGAGILSSSGESKYSLSDVPGHVPYDPYLIVQTPYIIDRYQSQYFVIDSYKQLFESIPNIDDAIQKELKDKYNLVLA